MFLYFSLASNFDSIKCSERGCGGSKVADILNRHSNLNVYNTTLLWAYNDKYSQKVDTVTGYTVRYIGYEEVISLVINSYLETYYF